MSNTNTYAKQDIALFSCGLIFVAPPETPMPDIAIGNNDLPAAWFRWGEITPDGATVANAMTAEAQRAGCDLFPRDYNVTERDVTVSFTSYSATPDQLALALGGTAVDTPPRAATTTAPAAPGYTTVRPPLDGRPKYYAVLLRSTAPADALDSAGQIVYLPEQLILYRAFVNSSPEITYSHAAARRFAVTIGATTSRTYKDAQGRGLPMDWQIGNVVAP